MTEVDPTSALRLVPIPPARDAIPSEDPAPVVANTRGLVPIPGASDGGNDRPRAGTERRLTGTVRQPTGADPGARTSTRTSITGTVGADGANNPADVRYVQERLAAHGFLAAAAYTAGTLNDATLEAIRNFQYRIGFLEPDGRVDLRNRTLRSLRMSPEALARQLHAVPARPADPAPNPAAPNPAPNAAPNPNPVAVSAPVVVAPTAVSGPADAELARRQALALEAAERELAAFESNRRGYRETSSNRSPRIDRYARSAGHDVGLEWCGNFIAFCYEQAGMRRGEDGRTQMSNGIRATYFFNYRQYTNGSRARRGELDALRAEHRAAGSERQFWTVPGSYGAQLGGNASLPSLRDRAVAPENLPLRAGDIYMIRTGSGDNRYYHIGMVARYFYDPPSGPNDRQFGWAVETVEGNIGGATVGRRVHYLNDPDFVSRLYGFGRPALGDLPNEPAVIPGI